MAGVNLIEILDNELVPKHEILSKEEEEELLKKYNTTKKHLPKILATDPIVKLIGAKKGDIIRITRKSPIAGEYYYYRVVV
ncbi:MAG: DNA-directed RNA polymerase subunit H [Candidatus Aenigmatarchaeota archaeon]